MKSEISFYKFFVSVLLLFVLFCSPAHASPVLGYIGPGAGLGMLGSLFAVLFVLALALLGPILYPIRLFLSWRRRRLLAGTPAGVNA